MKRRPVDVAAAALAEAGRTDLVDLIVWFDDPDSPGGGYLEVVDEVAGWNDYRLIDKAEQMARMFNCGHFIELREPVPGVTS